MTTTDSTETLDVIVVGGGQAGLAIAYHLTRQGADFLVLHAGGEIGESWRTRWDSLRLFTPAQYDTLPGMPFPARNDDYPTKDMVADYFRSYAARFALPVRLGCAVERVEHVAGEFVVYTGPGPLRAHQAVIATGPFQAPVIPSLAADLSGEVAQLHSATYRRPVTSRPARSSWSAPATRDGRSRRSLPPPTTSRWLWEPHHCSCRNGSRTGPVLVVDPRRV
jgi:putative flavoprotein involved in K+ transport